MPAIRGPKSKKKTRRYTRDVDQIHQDLRDPKHLAAFHETYNAPAEELPGQGQFYCIECSIWFPSEDNKQAHTKSKRHKRKVRALLEEPYSLREAQNAAGISVDNGRGVEPITIPKPGKVQTDSSAEAVVPDIEM